MIHYQKQISGSDLVANIFW